YSKNAPCNWRLFSLFEALLYYWYVYLRNTFAHQTGNCKAMVKKTLQLGELVSEDDNGENNNQPYINITISYFNPCPLS
ncbi:hypothetical protein, partial [Providencia rustigianii]